MFRCVDLILWHLLQNVMNCSRFWAYFSAWQGFAAIAEALTLNKKLRSIHLKWVSYLRNRGACQIAGYGSALDEISFVITKHQLIGFLHCIPVGTMVVPLEVLHLPRVWKGTSISEWVAALKFRLEDILICTSCLTRVSESVCLTIAVLLINRKCIFMAMLWEMKVPVNWWWVWWLIRVRSARMCKLTVEILY